MKILFLDVDGCLNRQHSGKTPCDKFGLAPDCVAALRRVVEATGCRLVLTSAWKRQVFEPLVSADRPWRDVLEEALGAPGAIIADCPDLDGRVERSRRYTRADDVLEYLKRARKDVESYAIIDDEVSCYRGTLLEPRVVDCELRTGRGLDDDLAGKAIAILNTPLRMVVPSEAFCPAPPSPDAAPGAEEAGDLVYESLFDDARNMAHALRRVDDELRAAARRAGEGPGAYPPGDLLPALCGVMYSCTGNFRDGRYD